MQRRELLAFLSFLIAPAIAHAAECDNKPGYYVNGSGECVECTNAAYYCPGDGTRVACPPLSGNHVPLWSAEHPDFTQTQSVTFYSSTLTASQITQCIAKYYITDGHALMQYNQSYNPITDKYDTFFSKWWYWPYAGYYLTSLRSCPLSGTWNEVATCKAGGYCPGEAAAYQCVNGKSPEYYGLYVCGDNSYSDAGAAACTPCPAGTGNSGDTLADHAGAASCQEIKCSAGQYLGDDGYTCVPCEIGYYCPGDNERHYCSDKYKYYNPDRPYYVPYYSDEPGATDCKKCPEFDGTSTYWYYANDNTSDLHVHKNRYYCRATWTVQQEHGTLRVDCRYGNSGYGEAGQNCQLGKAAQKCDAGYYIDDTDRKLISSTSSKDNIFIYDYPTLLANEYCTPVPVGYYSMGNTWAATACDDGYSTHRTGANSADLCEQLCTAGVTEFHAGDLMFSLWNQCASPALRVGIGGDVCCVNLESGTATGAVHVQYGGATYHTVN